MQLTSYQCNGGVASAPIEVQLTSCQCNVGAANGGAASASGKGPCVILAELAAHCGEE